MPKTQKRIVITPDSPSPVKKQKRIKISLSPSPVKSAKSSKRVSPSPRRSPEKKGSREKEPQRPAASKPATPLFGHYEELFHPGCRRTVLQSSGPNRVVISGADEDGVEWSHKGTVRAVGDGWEILVDGLGRGRWDSRGIQWDNERYWRKRRAASKGCTSSKHPVILDLCDEFGDATSVPELSDFVLLSTEISNDGRHRELNINGTTSRFTIVVNEPLASGRYGNVFEGTFGDVQIWKLAADAPRIPTLHRSMAAALTRSKPGSAEYAKIPPMIQFLKALDETQDLSERILTTSPFTRARLCLAVNLQRNGALDTPGLARVVKEQQPADAVSDTAQRLQAQADPEMGYAFDDVIAEYWSALSKRFPKLAFRHHSHFARILSSDPLPTWIFKQKKNPLISKDGIWNFDLAFYPVEEGLHWTLVVLDFRKRQAFHYNSLQGTAAVSMSSRRWSALTAALSTVDAKAGEWRNVATLTPRQGNAKDCGFFVMKIAEVIAKDSLSVSPDVPAALAKAFPPRSAGADAMNAHMAVERYRLIYEIFDPRAVTESQCIVKVQNEALSFESLAVEIFVHIKMFCQLPSSLRGAAGIPKPLFVTYVHGAMADGRIAVGMSKAEASLLAYLVEVRDSTSNDELITTFREVVRQLCELLEFLQKFQFVHGDMHIGNVMCRRNPFQVLLIDFGYSSVTMPGSKQRIYSQTAYEGMLRNDCLDLTMFLESSALTMGCSKQNSSKLHRLIMTVLGPLWNRVLDQTTLVTAEGGILKSVQEHADRPSHQHFYWNAKNLSYAPTKPKNLLKILDSIIADGDLDGSIGLYVTHDGKFKHHFLNSQTIHLGPAPAGARRARFVEAGLL